MSKTKKFDYLEVYLYAKEHGIDKASENYGLSKSRIYNTVSVGNDFLKDRPVPHNAKTIDKFTPREMMEELSKRGYHGKLEYTQVIDINKL